MSRPPSIWPRSILRSVSTIASSRPSSIAKTSLHSRSLQGARKRRLLRFATALRVHAAPLRLGIVYRTEGNLPSDAADGRCYYRPAAGVHDVLIHPVVHDVLIRNSYPLSRLRRAFHLSLLL